MQNSVVHMEIQFYLFDMLATKNYHEMLRKTFLHYWNWKGLGQVLEGYGGLAQVYSSVELEGHL